MGMFTRQIFLLLIVGVTLIGFSLDSCFGQQSPAGHTCDHGHHHHDEAHHHHSHGDTSVGGQSKKLPEELAEEEDLKLYGFESTHHHHDHHDHHHDHDHSTADLKLSGAGLWIHALGCSLLVSMASLICLILLPVIFVKGKPSKAIVDSLALFGAGAMLGDAFLHQLPHAFGGAHSHGHEHNHSSEHDHDHSGHAHSLKDLSVGLSVLFGIVVFLIVEKVVRYVEERAEGSNSWGYHHHHHNSSKKVKDDGDAVDGLQNSNDEKHNQPESALKKRKKKVVLKDDKSATNSSSAVVGDPAPARQPSNLVFGYLNLFSDSVHNFTDGIALGSAFLLYGSIGGWSRTLFLLAHELPQEVGDFGILVRSGFSVPKALFFNFLSALAALGGTALALLIGQDPGQSSIIEGFTAGGFIYIAVAGVLAEMNNNGSSGWRSTIVQLVSLISGMAIALCISLVE
ncbi:hypothetical protein V2J09_003952 [Rumex salicifolius]